MSTFPHMTGSVSFLRSARKVEISRAPEDGLLAAISLRAQYAALFNEKLF